MKRTENILNKIGQALNENEKAQEFLNALQEKAKAENWTNEKWEEAKTNFMTMIFYKMALDHKDIRDELAADVYEMYNEE